MSIDVMLNKARQAMEEIKDYSQEQVDEMTAVVSKKIYDNAAPLAELAVKETGFGRVDHKTLKNRNAAESIYATMKGKKSVGIIDEIPTEGLVEIAHPVGVIGSVTPTTNPSVTPLGNGLMAFKGRNAVIISPHPRAKETTRQTIDLIREALAEVGAPRDLMQMIEEPSTEASQALMSQTDVIVATGGPGLVKAAYSSGTPAYGVGPGNVQAVLDRDFDVPTAAKLSVISRSFDNGLVCACQQSLFYPQEKEAEVFAALTAEQAYVIDNEVEIDKLRAVLFPEGTKMNPKLIGQYPVDIARAAGIEIPEDTQIIVVKIADVGEKEVLNREKLTPVMVVKGYDTFEEAVEDAKTNLLLEGAGHSAGIFTNNREHEIIMGMELPVCRIVVNQPTIDAGGSLTNGLTPTVSLGCGSWGGNIISENLSFKHLLNVSRVSEPIERKIKGTPWD